MKKILILITFLINSFLLFGQSEWVEVNTFAGNLKSIFFIDKFHGWAVGDNGVAIKTVDGGYTWTSLFTGTKANLNSVAFLNKNIGFASGSSGTIIKTTNGGTSWSPLNSNTTENLSKGMKIISSTNIIIPFVSFESKAESKYLFSNDGGNTWSTKTMGANYYVFCFEFIDGNTGFAGLGPSVAYNSDSMIVYKTTDGGNTWNLLYLEPKFSGTSFAYSGMVSMSFINSMVGYGYVLTHTGFGKIVKTTDGGVTWTKVTSCHDRSGQVFYHSDQTIWQISFDMMGQLYSIFKSKDDFDNCIPSHNLQVTDYFFFKDNSNLGWAINGSSVYRYDPIAHSNIKFYTNVNPNASNPNNILVPGKIVRFKVEVKNNTFSNLLTLSGTISTNNPYVTIKNSTGTFNNIQSGAKGWSANEFEIELSNNIPNNEVIEFEMTLNDQINKNGPWVNSFSFPVILNPFNMSNNIIDDDNIPDSKGNNNDIAEPGETIEIIPLMDNNTNHGFSDLKGYLFTPYPEIEIWNNVQGATEMVYNNYSYGNIGPNAVNAMPEKDFVFNNNFTTLYSLPFDMIMTGYVSSFNGSKKYKDIEFRWGTGFIMNGGQPNPPTPLSNLGTEKVEIKIFPNPNNGKFLVEGEDIQKIEVFDVSGKLVTLINNTKSERQIKMDLINNGIYFIKVYHSDKILVKKIITN